MANNIQLAAKDITDLAFSKVLDMEKKKEIAFPPNYSYSNALKAAQLVLLETKDKDNRPVLEVCSKESIINALLGMVTRGLNVQKNQCYFIPFGNQLQLMISYMGKIAMAKRIPGIVDIKAYALYDGDTFHTEFDAEKGVLRVKEYKPEFKNINAGKVIGAFAMVIGREGVLHTEVMTMAQIQAAWKMGKATGKSLAHNNFSEEMAKKSVISRAIKLYINTSDDSDLLLDSEPGEYEDYIDLDAKETLPEEAPKLMDFKEAPEAPKEGAQENDPPTIDPGF